MSEANASPPTIEPQNKDAPTRKHSSTEMLAARTKSYAWRLTACYVWIKILCVFLGFYTSLSQLESNLLAQLITFLSSIGFAPANLVLLSTVLKVGWLLAITRFKLFEVLGLLIYIITFPVWAPIVGVFLYFSKAQKEASTSKRLEQGLVRRRRSPNKVFAICSSLLLGWFLLYGNANATKQVVPGVVLAGLFLLLLTYRLFSRVKPEKDINVNVPPFGWLGKLSLVSADIQHPRLAKEYKTKAEVQADGKVVNFTRRLFVHITLLLRGRVAQERISLYVLAEYLFSLIISAASAILFWALMIKAFYLTSLPLLICVHLSLSHFLPGIQPPILTNSVPVWTSIGPAATSWILFVLYIGPASSMLPERQRATIRGLAEVHNLYRKSVKNLAIEKTRLKKIESNLAS